MTVKVEENLFSRFNGAMVNVLNMFAIWALAAMMFLTFADVLLRYLFNSPIQGAKEIIEFLMAIVVPFSIVYCAKLRGHIGVDFIVERFPRHTRNVLDALMRLLMIALFIPISWQTILFVSEELASGLTSPVLYIPVYPFVAIVALAFCALTLILIEQFISSLSEVAS